MSSNPQRKKKKTWLGFSLTAAFRVQLRKGLDFRHPFLPCRSSRALVSPLPWRPHTNNGVRGHLLPPCAASKLHTAEWHVSATGMGCTSAPPPLGLGLIICERSVEGFPPERSQGCFKGHGQVVWFHRAWDLFIKAVRVMQRIQKGDCRFCMCQRSMELGGQSQPF